MKLSRLYSNQPSVFAPIRFNSGLSAVLAEIRLPENRDLDTHNLGKTTVGELLDFCLLKGKDPSFFLYRHEARFEKFAFYLELEVEPGSYLTIGRRVNPGSRIEFKRTQKSIGNAASFAEDDWDHYDVAFERARLLLDGTLDIQALRPWGFRKLVGYLIRSQQDYRDVFQLGKFSGKHQDWKPFVAHLLGMDAQLVIDLYDKRAEVESATSQLNTLTQEWGDRDADPSLLDGLISVKRREIEEKETALDSFNFREEDRRVAEDIVDRAELVLAARNEERYQLAQLIRQIEDSLEVHQVTFRPRDAEELFRDAGILFAEQITKDFNQLIDFNRAITRERRDALQTQVKDARARIEAIDDELVELNRERASSLEYLRETDALAKYKELSRSLATLQADLTTLEARRAAAARLIDLRQERRSLAETYGHLQTAVETQLEQVSQDEESQFGRIRRYFSDIVFEVLGEHAILAMSLNSQGGIDFRAEFISQSGTATSGDRGTSYKKLLCIAFDLAILRANLNHRFPRFVYFDGALEQLEPRKREKLLKTFRDYVQIGLQPILSLLDSDLPAPLGSSDATLAATDVVLTLHDEGDQGRLFKMPPW